MSNTTRRFLTALDNGLSVTDAVATVATSTTDVIGIIADLDREAYDCIRDLEAGQSIDALELLTCIVN